MQIFSFKSAPFPMKHDLTVKLDRIIRSVQNNLAIPGAVFQIRCPQRDLSLTRSFGNMQEQTPYYIASINKIMIAALILKIADTDERFLQTKILAFDTKGLLAGLAMSAGKDYTSRITAWHLLTQTSGLPCYLLDKIKGSKPVMNMLLSGQDEAWPYEKVIAHVKGLGHKFVPGEAGSAHYSNTNYRILAEILRVHSGMAISELLHTMFNQLEMTETFVVKRNETRNLLPLQIGKQSILPLNYFYSSGFDIYSTAGDQMKFLSAFFTGKLFSTEQLPRLYQWNRIFFPLQYGGGLQRFSVPRWLSPFKPFPEMIGHSGSVGSFAFYVPAKDVFITGSVNQPKRVRTAFQTLARIVNAL